MADNALGTLFTDIAYAIREMSGQNVTMKPIDFPANILAIPVSCGDSESGGDSGSAGGNGSGLKITSGSFKPNTGKSVITPAARKFSKHATYSDYYCWEQSPAAFELTPGANYAINFCGLQRSGVATTVASLGGLTNCIALGNTDLLNGGGSLPFLILYSPDEDKSVVFSSYTASELTLGAYEVSPAQVTVEHGLGEMPDFVIVYYNGLDIMGTGTAYSGQITSVWGLHSKFAEQSSILSAFSGSGVSGELSAYGIDNMLDSYKKQGYIFCDDASTFTLGDISNNAISSNLMGDQTYSWIAISGIGGGAVEYPSAEEASF